MTRAAIDSSGTGFQGGAVVQSLYNGVGQNITTTGASQQSSAFAQGTTVIRIVCKGQAVWYKVGPNPTAVAGGDSCFLPANVVEFPQVCRGDKIAVVQDSAGGTFNIVEMI